MSSCRLEGQVAIVTGAGKGLGRAFARHLAAQGAAVVVNNRNSSASEVASEIRASGGRAVADNGSVEDPSTSEALVTTALEVFGRLDICVTSAAVSRPEIFHETTAENLRAVLDVNVVGTALVAAAASRVMRAAGYGRIVLVASTAGLHGEPTVSAYAASKGAVIALGRTIAVEGARKGVLTNVLLPYATTQMTEAGMDRRYASLMRAETVAPVVGALADRGCQLNGQVIVVAANGLRAADAVEGATAQFPPGLLAPARLAALLAESRGGGSRSYPEAQAAFRSLAADLT